MKPVRIYIGVVELANTKDSLLHIINKIKNSNLRNEKIIIVHSSKWQKYDYLLESDLNIEYYNSNLDSDSYEFPTLFKMWQDAAIMDFNGLYIHCKGSSYTDSVKYENAKAWSTLMMYGVIDNSDLCIHHLNKGADYVGSLFYWHFKGNFYWFRSEYIKQLVNPMDMDHSYRLNAEFWGSYSYWWGRYPLPKVKNLFYIPWINDDDFINIKYYPEIFDKHILKESFSDFLKRYKYEQHDIILMSNHDFIIHRNIIKRYLNYDGIVINCDTRSVLKYDEL